MQGHSRNSFDALSQFTCAGQPYAYFSLERAAQRLGDLSRLPFSLKVLLENLLRHEDGQRVDAGQIEAFPRWLANGSDPQEIAFHPARVLMQDFTGVPALVDLAAMRDAMAAAGGDPALINPLTPVDLVIDHSVSVDAFARADAFDLNVRLEMQRNHERYAFLRWGQRAFKQFRVVPPGTGICHQVNLEYLAQVVCASTGAEVPLAYPDSLVGTDSHTTMINGLAVLGWGVGGIEAEAVMLGQPISLRLPEVVGLVLEGRLAEGVTATDLVLSVTELLRSAGVVGKLVEFCGPGLAALSLPDRATLANMAPEYGATCGIFPIDGETLRYLRLTGRSESRVALVESYARAQGMFHDGDTPEPRFSTRLSLDLRRVVASLAGPRRPQDRVSLDQVGASFSAMLASDARQPDAAPQAVDGEAYELSHGDVLIAAITSCTNTSNPAVMLAAGLVARNARRRGLQVKPWVKTSLAPGSQVVSDYLAATGLSADLDALGFNLVGYGCTTCIGNSGPLSEPITAAVERGELFGVAVLSGNRNFEGRINPHVRASYLASPPLVVAYALAGSVRLDLLRDPLGEDADGQPVLLADLWPDNAEVQALLDSSVTAELFRQRYDDVFSGPPLWQAIAVAEGQTYAWDERSNYVRLPPYFAELPLQPPAPCDLRGARPLLILGDSVTTDHISPAGSIAADGAAGQYLRQQGVAPDEFNSYGSRRGNHEVMMRGTFANIRLRNRMVEGVSGGVTRLMPDDQQLSVFDAAMRYQERGVPLVVIAGQEYGTGSSRDWAAKGTALLGVRAVLAQSFERIHRSNLLGMGVLPLQFEAGVSADSLQLDAGCELDIGGIAELKPGAKLMVDLHRPGKATLHLPVRCRIDTADELSYFRHGGILHYVLRELLQSGAGSATP